MNETITRQQRRYIERRANKPEPSTIVQTSGRHIGLTKGKPFSRMKLESIIPSSEGKPAIFNVCGYTTNKKQSIKATFQNIDWFIRGLTPEMKMTMLG